MSNEFAAKNYFDYNATSDILPEVKAAITEAISYPLNPSSIHYFGRRAKNIIESSRIDIARMIDVNPKQYNITFTSSATEANNLMIRSFLKQSPNCRILVSSIEHPSILKLRDIASNIDILKVTKDGIVDMEDLVKWLTINKDNLTLVSVMLANNETGVIQPMKEIASIVHSYKGLIHSDCAQAPSKISFSVSDLDIDFVSISSHKLGGIHGAGALACKAQYQLTPTILGGGQERGARAGTENVPAILGFGIAARVAKPQTSYARDIFEHEVTKICNKAIIFCKDVPRLPNTTMMYMPNISTDIQLIKFDMRNIYVSSGSACSSGKVKTSDVLAAMGVPNEIANCTIRFSFGRDHGEEDAINLAKIWHEIYIDSLNNT